MPGLPWTSLEGVLMVPAPKPSHHDTLEQAVSKTRGAERKGELEAGNLSRWVYTHSLAKTGRKAEPGIPPD